jgi:hypothetical protein
MTPEPRTAAETPSGNRMAAWLGELIWALPGLDEQGRERMQALGNEKIAAIEVEARTQGHKEGYLSRVQDEEAASPDSEALRAALLAADKELRMDEMSDLSHDHLDSRRLAFIRAARAALTPEAKP